MIKRNRVLLLIASIVYILLTNSVLLLEDYYWYIVLFSIIAIVVNFFIGFFNSFIKTFRLKICNHGYLCLETFRITMVISIVIHIVAYWVMDLVSTSNFIISLITGYIFLLILFWNGIISVYCTSVQLGIKHRIIGIICGMIPIANLICLSKIIKICREEIYFEADKIHLNEARKDEQICRTKYPILLVHGVFFRDYHVLNYWGRIPKELETNGATLFYGKLSSALPVIESAKELEKRVLEIVSTTGCEKINIIAHSKGGLDSRALLKTSARSYIASITTINTPHKGCEFADFLLNKASEQLKENLSNAYNFAAKKLGDPAPDFLSAVNDLTHTNCLEFNENNKIPGDIYCQSFGSVLKGFTSSSFPLNLTYQFVKHFDGNHDGLVSVNSFEFGQKFTMLENKYNRGISHADVIDLNRENIPGFDVREFYVSIVSDLKNRGF